MPSEGRDEARRARLRTRACGPVRITRGECRSDVSSNAGSMALANPPIIAAFESTQPEQFRRSGGRDRPVGDAGNSAQSRASDGFFEAPLLPLADISLNARSARNVRSTTVAVVTPEERFIGIRQTAACVHLNREQITELIGITATLFEERKRIRRALEQLPESFGEVRKILNELARTVR